MKKINYKIMLAVIFTLVLMFQLALGTLAARDAVGDLDGNGVIDKDDAIHLLGNSLFPTYYPVDQPVDFNHDGIVDKEDALYLLGHTIFADLYYICQHDEDKWTEKEVVTPTCDEQGYTVIVCECGEEEIINFTPADAEAHIWEVKDDSHKATCLENGYVVMICTVCETEETVDEIAPGHKYTVASCEEDSACEVCEAVISAKGHTLSETPAETHEATCTSDGYNVYECKDCGYKYKEITTPRTGHAVSDDAFEDKEMRAAEGKECVYVWVEQAVCTSCGEAVERVSEEFTYHVESVSITEATCTAAGVKLTSCKECGKTLLETEIPLNTEAHAWIVAATEDTGTNYECSICHATKKTITASSADAVDMGAADEVSVGGVTLSPDEVASEQLSGESIYVSAENKSAADIDNISDELAERLGDDPIYDITIKNESMDEISSFDGWITVSVPYTLAEGEDPDTIIVWYIDEEGNVTAIEDVEYRNGHAIFKTNHFSKYCVTRMTNEEICLNYGHSYIDCSVPATCATGGYTAERCTRCNDLHVSERFDALGHEWEVIRDTNPTCAKEGETVYACERCDNTYRTTKAALGHDYQPEEESGNTSRYKAPTCTEPGEHYIVCTKCADEYSEEIPCSGHDDVETVVEPGCETVGYTKYTCNVCQSVREKNVKLPLGHDYEEGKCTRCSAECEHEFYYGECKKCKIEKSNEPEPEPDPTPDPEPEEHVHEYIRYELNYGCETHFISYNECDCGDFGGFAWWVGSFDKSREGETTIYTCDECEVRIEKISEHSPKDENCNVNYKEDVSIYNDGDLVAHRLREYSQTVHGYSSTLEFKEGATSCEEGIIVTNTCENCGLTKTHEVFSHYLMDEHYFTEACAEHEMVYMPCFCGKTTGFMLFWGFETQRINDNYYIYTCDKCGVRIESITEISEKDENCNYTQTTRYKIHSSAGLFEISEEPVILNGCQKKYIFTLMEGSQYCEDGAIITEYCPVCNNTDSWEVYDHTTVRVTYDWGCTRHGVNYTRCACGQEESLSYNPDSFAWTSEEGKTTYFCYDCDARIEESYVRGEKNENCELTIETTAVVTCGDTVIETTYTGTAIEHDSEYICELAFGATSCEDGVIVTQTCKCGYTETYTDYYHVIYGIDLGACESHELELRSCACGEYGYSWWNWGSFDRADTGDVCVFICEECNLRIESYEEVSDTIVDCALPCFTHDKFYKNGEQVAYVVVHGYYERHNCDYTYSFVEGATSCEDGVIKSGVCKDCGETDTYTYYYHESIVYETVDVECARNHNIFYEECLCGENRGLYYNWDTFLCENEPQASTLYCEDCIVWIKEYYVRSEKDEYCQITTTYYTDVYLGDELVYSWPYVSVKTSHPYEFKKLVDECSDVINEDGTRTVVLVTEEYCPDCLASLAKHKQVSEYDADGFLTTETTYNYNYVAVNETETVEVLYREYYTEYTRFVSEFSSEPIVKMTYQLEKYIDNGEVVSWTKHEYTYDEANPCLVTCHSTNSRGHEYTETYTSHDSITSKYVLGEGGTTCLDGVVRIHYCVLCGTETNRVNYGSTSHDRTNASYTIDVQKYGALCDVELTVYECPCGMYGYVSVNDDADYDSYWVYRDGREYQIYTCAVTDPVACKFVWVREIYTEIGEDCYNTTYYNYYFGVDKDAQTYVGEPLSFKKNSDEKQHEETYKIEITENGSIETWTCAKCSQLIRTREEKREGTLLTRTWTYYDNKTGTVCTSEDVCVYRNINGYDVVVSETHREFDSYGEVSYWEKDEYTYPNSANGDYCNYVRVWINSYGKEATYTGVEHVDIIEYAVYSNCVEILWEELCLSCGNKDRYVAYYVNAHDFYYDVEKGLFVCRECGLENANGANGDIAFVDVSHEGDGTSYIVNYNKNRSIYDYTYAVLLHVEGADAPITLNGSIITDDTANRRLYIDAQAVLEAAAELGVSACGYEIEVAFIPTTSNGSLVYSIFIDGHIHLVDEENTVIPEGGCKGDGGTTVAMKCALCGDSYTVNYTEHSTKVVESNYEKTTDEDGNKKLVITKIIECEHCGARWSELNIRTNAPDGSLLLEETIRDGYKYTEEYDYANDKRTDTSIYTDENGVVIAKYVSEYELSTGRKLSYYSYYSETDWYKYTYEWYTVNGETRQFVVKNEGPNRTYDYTYEFNEAEDRYTENAISTNAEGVAEYTDVREYEISTGNCLSELRYWNETDWWKRTYMYYVIDESVRQFTTKYEDSTHTTVYTYEFNTPEEGQYTTTEVTTYTDGTVEKTTVVRTMEAYSWDEEMLSQYTEYADGSTYSFVRVEDAENDKYTETTIRTNAEGVVTYKAVSEYELSTGRALSELRYWNETDWWKCTYEYYEVDGWKRPFTTKYECPYYTTVYTYEFNTPEEGQYTVTMVTTYTDGTVEESTEVHAM